MCFFEQYLNLLWKLSGIPLLYWAHLKNWYASWAAQVSFQSLADSAMAMARASSRILLRFRSVSRIKSFRFLIIFIIFFPNWFARMVRPWYTVSKPWADMNFKEAGARIGSIWICSDMYDKKNKGYFSKSAYCVYADNFIFAYTLHACKKYLYKHYMRIKPTHKKCKEYWRETKFLRRLLLKPKITNSTQYSF